MLAAGTEKAARVGIFKVYSTNATEIVLGEHNKHLDFRLSILCSAGVAPASARQLTISTVVRCQS